MDPNFKPRAAWNQQKLGEAGGRSPEPWEGSGGAHTPTWGFLRGPHPDPRLLVGPTPPSQLLASKLREQGAVAPTPFLLLCTRVEERCTAFRAT